jgi:hypothetical protein
MPVYPDASKPGGLTPLSCRAPALEPRKIYRVLPDPAAARRRQIRIVDESGEDYLYPELFFVPIKLPEAVEEALHKAS